MTQNQSCMQSISLNHSSSVHDSEKTDDQFPRVCRICYGGENNVEDSLPVSNSSSDNNSVIPLADSAIQAYGYGLNDNMNS